MCAKLWKTCISSKIPCSFRECQSKKKLSDYIHEVFYPKVTFFKDLCGAFKICLVAFLNSFPVLIFCSFPMHLLFSKICFLVLFMMNHYLQDFLSMNSSMLTNTFSKLAHSIACIISNKRLAYFLVTFFLASVCISGLKESRVMLTHCTVVAVSQILQCPVNWYFCSGVTITASSRKWKQMKGLKRPKKRNTFCTTGFFLGVFVQFASFI